MPLILKNARVFMRIKTWLFDQLIRSNNPLRANLHIFCFFRSWADSIPYTLNLLNYHIIILYVRNYTYITAIKKHSYNQTNSVIM